MPLEVERVEPAFISGESESLSSWLDFHRATLVTKCLGLSGAQMVLASVPPSGLTLLGLVQHMELVEWWWFDHIFSGGDSPQPYEDADDPDAEFHLLDPDRAEGAIPRFLAQCQRSRDIVAAADGLDARSVGTERETRDLRWVMVHMIEEYARHNGHADLLRESIDGVVGD